MSTTPRAVSSRTWLTIFLAVIILVPSMLGFLAKFIEFTHTFRGEADGAFAITPMINYMFATLGFLCMLIWACLNGMFHDTETPKNIMLQREKMLDRLDDLHDDFQRPSWPFPRINRMNP